ncbi:DUF5641 domain-containing protein [Nephila pilipes]|uniref:DUF5641 domain-containing protein n=1 Tax=Nephila pilipes TaxID=299642 RepID=A0A8X6QW75_NEPPI|nr:DUF5641 domain-containing protein [Nephila pilipes]
MRKTCCIRTASFTFCKLDSSILLGGKKKYGLVIVYRTLIVYTAEDCRFLHIHFIVKMSGKSLSIHVTYGNQTFICSSAKKDFLNKVSEKYNINKDEIEIYEIEKKMKKRISVEDLKDFMKVEIRKKPHAVNRSNGQSYSSVASTSKAPSEAILAQKLLDNGSFTGLERAFLLQCLKNHFNPLKRKIVTEAGTPDIRPEMKNRKVQVDAGNLISRRTTYTQTDELINYQPPLNNTTFSNEIIAQSKKLAASDKIDSAVATDLMAKSFDKRRNFILVERPVVSFVKEKYPLLFNCTEVRNELDRIFYNGKCQEFISNIEKYAPHVLSMARDDDPLLETTKKKMELYPTNIQKKYAQEVGAILMISSLMHEDRIYLKLLDNTIPSSHFPYIESSAKLDDIFFDQHLFRVYAEGQYLCEASDLKEALLCLIASYFIFNIKYNDFSFGTLVVFEKLFLEANDTDENDIDIAVLQIIRSIQLKQQARS